MGDSGPDQRKEGVAFSRSKQEEAVSAVEDSPEAERVESWQDVLEKRLQILRETILKELGPFIDDRRERLVKLREEHGVVTELQCKIGPLSEAASFVMDISESFLNRDGWDQSLRSSYGIFEDFRYKIESALLDLRSAVYEVAPQDKWGEEVEEYVVDRVDRKIFLLISGIVSELDSKIDENLN